MASTTRCKRGDIVLVPFPFTDLSSSKRRPALVISPDAFNDQMQDLVVAAITSQLAADHAITIEESDCVDGALPKTSVVKLAKVFTIHSTLVIKKICVLQQEKLDAVLGELRRFFSQTSDPDLLAGPMRLTATPTRPPKEVPTSMSTSGSSARRNSSIRMRTSSCCCVVRPAFDRRAGEKLCSPKKLLRSETFSVVTLISCVEAVFRAVVGRLSHR